MFAALFSPVLWGCLCSHAILGLRHPAGQILSSISCCGILGLQHPAGQILSTIKGSLDHAVCGWQYRGRSLGPVFGPLVNHFVLDHISLHEGSVIMVYSRRAGMSLGTGTCHCPMQQVLPATHYLQAMPIDVLCAMFSRCKSGICYDNDHVWA